MSRIGEERISKFGYKMIITKYENNNDIDVYFPEYDWTFKHSHYQNFKKGSVKCPYEKRFSGVLWIDLKNFKNL